MEILDQIISHFNSEKLTLGLAESCTGGGIAARITDEAGVSSFFLGGVVSYHGSVKEAVLGVSGETLKAHGEVSCETAIEMARGAQKTLSTDWALSVTGIAGPGGGTKAKPVGTVCFAVAGPKFEFSQQKLIAGSSRKEIRQQTIDYGLKLLWDCLKT